MRFNTKAAVKIVMLGAGGTGAHIAPHLYRLLYSVERPVRVIIADGDAVEEKNLVRQNFAFADIGVNKARVIAERYASAFKLEAEYIPDFIENAERLRELVTPLEYRVPRNDWRDKYERETVILIGAVDNNKSRRLCHEVFMCARDLVYIDSGNGEFSGQVVCGVRRGGRTMSKPVGLLYPDVLTETDKFPSELSCTEASVSAPQAITANLTAATAVVDLLYNILVVGENRVESVTFSTKSVNVQPKLKAVKRAA
ncbi:MAG: ThiF family adenylyltransferase [Oscillospiraceae bacterium]|jgi:hypothetical protein|nr:ThiF family adenylyltransferase [Oscillospiraceae bacterium]